MTQERLNNLMLLYVHQVILVKIDLLQVTEDFVSDSNHIVWSLCKISFKCLKMNLRFVLKM